MDPQKIRELTDDEVAEEIRLAREELFRLKFRGAYEELESPSLLKTLRRDVARLMTIQRERQLAEQVESNG